jgi:hypothetical protein
MAGLQCCSDAFMPAREAPLSGCINIFMITHPQQNVNHNFFVALKQCSRYVEMISSIPALRNIGIRKTPVELRQF